jgi:hypothetical protein
MQLGVAAPNKVQSLCPEHEGIRKASAGHLLSPQEFKRWFRREECRIKLTL